VGVAVRPDVHAIDGITPRNVVRATSEAEVADAIRLANERAEAIVLTGGATRLGVGDPPARYDTALDLSALRGIVEYEPGDLVATVRAGTTLAELAEALTPRGQRWPV
jgi:glycolate oxidase FAD binding subunit